MRERTADRRRIGRAAVALAVAAGALTTPGAPDRVAGQAPAADLRSVGEALAAQVLETGSSESIARTKRLLLEVAGRPLGEALALAAEANAEARATEDCKRGIATFLETKKAPKWR